MFQVAALTAGLDHPHTGLMTQDKRLGLVLAINLAMVVSLLLVGVLAHSLGVLASGADYLGDALGTGLSLVARRLSRHRYGHPRATSYAALANSSFLLLVTLAVMAEAIRRLSTGAPSIHGVPVVIVSLVAAVAMIACAFILGDVEGDLSMESVMLDTVADAAAAIGVAVSGAVILLTHGLYWLDSLVALVIAVVVGYHAVRLLRKVLLDLRGKQAAIAPNLH
jgi:cobalt-zinc-cadmium efflux system protein